MTIDPLRRFSSRARAYAAARPSYPRDVAELMRDAMGLGAGAVLADVGSGTGKLAEVLLEGGYAVVGVEPNAEMRAYAEAAFAGRPAFTSVDGTAQATTLAGASVDAVTAGQAFHWFDPAAVRAEWKRILRPGGWAILVWNLRRERATAFMAGYDDLIHRFATEMKLARAERADTSAIALLYDGRFETRTFEHIHLMDRETLRGRVVSSSFMPDASHPRHEEMLAATDALFERHAQHGFVRFEYDTPLYFGRLA